MSEIRRAPALTGLAVLGLVVAACGAPLAATSAPPASTPGTSAGPTAGGSGTPSPSASPTPNAIDHPTGATDVVLRLTETGGFLPLELIAARVPAFTLYGDGTLIVAKPGAVNINPVVGPTAPLVVATLDDAEVQRILDTALTKGGLAIARENYESVGIMDAPTTVFEIHAGGLDKTVRVLALGFEEPQPGPDTVARTNLQELRVFLDGIAATAIQNGQDFTPAGFTGVLIQLDPGQIAPAASIAPPAGADPIALPEHALTADHLADLGIEDLEGGYYGIVLDGPDGKRYSLIVRPQLPDQA